MSNLKKIWLSILLVVILIVGYFVGGLIFDYLSRSPMYEIEGTNSSYIVSESDVKSLLPNLSLNPAYIVKDSEKVELDIENIGISPYNQTIYDYVEQSYVFPEDNCVLVFFNNEGTRTDLDVCEKNEDISDLSVYTFGLSENYISIYDENMIYVMERNGQLVKSFVTNEGYSVTNLYEVDGSIFYIENTDYNNEDSEYNYTLYKYDLDSEETTKIYTSSKDESTNLYSAGNKVIFEVQHVANSYTPYNYYILDASNETLNTDNMLETKASFDQLFNDNNNSYISFDYNSSTVIYKITDKFTETGSIETSEDVYWSGFYSPKYIYYRTNYADEVKQYNMKGELVNTFVTNESEMTNKGAQSIYMYD